MQKFNKILAPAFLGLSMSLLFSVNSHASVDGWKAENGTWKYYKDYKALKSWQKLGNNWYFFNEDGSLKTGWLKDGNDNWYFLDLNSGSNQGVLLSGWQWIDGYCYYFETSDSGTLGRMYADKTVDGYKLNPMGRWVDNNGTELYDATRGISTNKQNLSSDKDLAKKASITAKRSSSSGGISRGSGGASSGGGSSSSTGSSYSYSSGNSSSSNSASKHSSDSDNTGSSYSYDNGSLSNSNSNSTKDSLIQSNNNSVSTDNSLNDAGGSSSANVGSSSNSGLSSSLGSVTKPSTGLVSQNQDSLSSDSNNKTNADSKQNTVPDKSNIKKFEDTNTENPKTGNGHSTPPSASENSTGSNAQDLVTQPNKPSDNTNPSDSTTATSSNAAPKPENKEIPNATEDSKKQENENKAKEQEENKADKVKDLLTTEKNNNVVQYTDEDGKIRTIIWAKGISAPIMGEGGDFRKEVTHAGSDTYIDYKAPFAFGNSWYDSNKSRAGGNTDIDKNLCFGATSANMLHWWFEQNSSYIDSYIAKEGDITRSGRSLSELRNSFNSQQDSGIFELFKVLFGYNDKGFYSDLLMDLFINGYTPKISGATNIENEDMTPDNRGGFFYNAFKEVKLTERTYGGSYEDLSEKLKDILGNEGIIGISHKTFGNSSHIVTLWGAEYDLNGKLSAVYVSDSDDQNEEADETNLGMKRYEVRNVGGIAKLSTNQSNKNAGSAIGYLHVLYLGSEQWQSYINQ